MISIVIVCDSEDRPVMATLAALVPGAAAGLVRDAILVNRGENAAIVRIADVAGCDVVPFAGSQAEALSTGARAAGAPWLMFLRPGTILDAGWVEEASRFIHEPANGESVRRAAAFSYAPRPYTRFGMTEVGKALQRWIAGPSAQQGLLIARAHYDELGGHRDPRRPEAALNRRIGRRSLVTLTTRAATI